jgi:hypothetical protein
MLRNIIHKMKILYWMEKKAKNFRADDRLPDRSNTFGEGHCFHIDMLFLYYSLYHSARHSGYIFYVFMFDCFVFIYFCQHDYIMHYR